MMYILMKNKEAPVSDPFITYVAVWVFTVSNYNYLQKNREKL